MQICKNYSENEMRNLDFWSINSKQNKSTANGQKYLLINYSKIATTTKLMFKKDTRSMGLIYYKSICGKDAKDQKST